MSKVQTTEGKTKIIRAYSRFYKCFIVAAVAATIVYCLAAAAAAT